MHKNYFQGILFCLVATISWGIMFPVMTSALEHIDPFTFTALRYTIAGGAFLILLLAKEGWSAFNMRGERISLAWFLGTCGFAGFGFLVFLGQKLSGPSGALSASIMMATMPMLGLLVNWAVKRVRPPLPSFCFILLSFCGVALVLTKGDFAAVLDAPANFSADVPLILGALCWVIYTVGATFFPQWSPYRYTTITTLLGLTSVFAINALLLVTGIVALPSAGNVMAILPHLVYMSLIAGLVGVLSWNLGNKIITPLNGVLFMDVVPITAFIISALSGIVPESPQVGGAGLTVTALILNNLYQRYRLANQNAMAQGASSLMATLQGTQK